MSEITRAIAARQTQITQLQSELETLQRATSVLGPPATAAAKTTPKPKPKSKAKPPVKATPTAAAKPKPRAKAKPAAKPQPKAKRKSKARRWTAAEKAAIGKRMKAYWAKRRKAKR